MLTIEGMEIFTGAPLVQIASERLIGQFVFPIGYNLAATFLFALTGVILATKRGYDFIGVSIMALIAGAGGGLIRDGVFLQQGPALFIQSPQFIMAVLLAVAVGGFSYHVVKRFDGLFFVADALGIGIYGVIGAQMTLNAGLGVMAAIIVGFVSAIGGGILRDVLIKKEPVIFFPGQFYALAALVGICTFLVLAAQLKVPAQVAAVIAIGVTFFIRLASLRFDFESKPLADFADVNRDQFFNLVDSLRPVIKRVQHATTIKSRRKTKK
jgi:uncharacterized membrane protein YeiH